MARFVIDWTLFSDSSSDRKKPVLVAPSSTVSVLSKDFLSKSRPVTEQEPGLRCLLLHSSLYKGW